MPAKGSPLSRGTKAGVPDDLDRTCADVALTAMIAGCAYVCLAAGRASAAARMQILVCCRQDGLLVSQKRRDVLSEFDTYWRRFSTDPRAARRIMVAAMTKLVGHEWAAAVLAAAEQVGLASGASNAASRQSLAAIRAALALPEP